MTTTTATHWTRLKSHECKARNPCLVICKMHKMSIVFPWKPHFLNFRDENRDHGVIWCMLSERARAGLISVWVSGDCGWWRKDCAPASSVRPLSFLIGQNVWESNGEGAYP